MSTLAASSSSVIRPGMAARTPRVTQESLAAWRRWLNTAVWTASAPAHRRVLLIAYQFPPTGGSGVQRPAKLAKCLPSVGWEVEVLTAGHTRFPWSDDSLLSDLPADLCTHRVAGREPACLVRQIGSLLPKALPRHRIEDALYWRLTRLTDQLGLGNGERFWIGPAVKAFFRQHRQAPFDAMISTGPPHFVHHVAKRIHEQTRLPWVADLRDPLMSDFDRDTAATLGQQHMQQLETDILQRAAVVVTTSPAFARDLRTRYPQRHPLDVRAITNGFDRDDLQRALPDDPEPLPLDECVFVAAGSFYGKREIARLVEPMQQVLSRHRHWRRRVRLIIAGTIDAEQRRRWQADKPEWLELAGYLDHLETIRLVTRATCSIIVVPRCRHGELSIPGKTFELMALPTHMLALVPPGSDTETLVQAAGGASVAPFEDSAAVAAAMEAIIRARFQGRCLEVRRWDIVDRHDRRCIAEEFAFALESACGDGPAAQMHEPGVA